MSTETASLAIFKIHLSGTISTKDAKYAATGIGSIYTNSKHDSPEYMQIYLSIIPQEIIEEYEAM